MVDPISVESLVARVRSMSGLRNNPLYTDADIVELLNVADQEIRDLIQKTNEHHLLTSVDFTLAGGYGLGNDTFPLPDDFSNGHSVDGNPDNESTEYTVGYITNWLERNKTKIAFRPRYFFRGADLVMYPASRAAGDFRLWYTPKGANLAVPVSQDFDIDPDDTYVTDSGKIGFIFSNLLPLNEGMVGGTLVTAFTGANDPAWNGTWTIGDVNDLVLVTTIDAPGPSFTNPAAGTGNLTYQPLNTSPSLAPVLSQFSRFHVLHASIAIRQGRQQDTDDLTQKLDKFTNHVLTTVANRAEEPEQPPLTRAHTFDDTIGAWGEWGP